MDPSGGMTTSKLVSALCKAGESATHCYAKVSGLMQAVEPLISKISPVCAVIKTGVNLGMTAAEKNRQYKFLQTDIETARKIHKAYTQTVNYLAQVEHKSPYKLCSTISTAIQVGHSFAKFLSTQGFVDLDSSGVAQQRLSPEWYRKELSAQLQYLQATMQLLMIQLETIEREVEAAKSIQSPQERIRAFAELATKYTCRASAAA